MNAIRSRDVWGCAMSSSAPAISASSSPEAALSSKPLISWRPTRPKPLNTQRPDRASDGHESLPVLIRGLLYLAALFAVLAYVQLGKERQPRIAITTLAIATFLTLGALLSGASFHRSEE